MTPRKFTLYGKTYYLLFREDLKYAYRVHWSMAGDETPARGTVKAAYKAAKLAIHEQRAKDKMVVRVLDLFLHPCGAGKRLEP